MVRVSAPLKLSAPVYLSVASASLICEAVPLRVRVAESLAPALMVAPPVVLTFSVMKRDGLGALAGHGLFLFTVGYFVFWGEVVVRVFHEAYARFAS
jgi:hypothetical protein